MSKDSDNMNNYCRNCGQKLKENQTECSCGAVVIDKRVDIDARKQEIIQFKKKEKTYLTVIISLLIAEALVSYISNNFNVRFLDSIPGLIALALFIAIITARVKCGESSVIRGLFAIMIAFLVFETVMGVLTVIACFGWMRYGCP